MAKLLRQVRSKFDTLAAHPEEIKEITYQYHITISNVVSGFDAKSVCILGRQPSLGMAELESLYGAKHLRLIDGAAILDIPAEKINFKRLGGTIKVARILGRVPSTDFRKVVNFLEENVPAHVEGLPDGKFTLGLSVYGINASVSDINRAALGIKKIVKKTGRSVRVVPNKLPALSSAQVLHNKLTHWGGWELLAIGSSGKAIIAQTLFVQDIEAYAARDQARPARDARVGMLPPKLAQIIINLAMSAPEFKDPDTEASQYRIFDPFCGTGVILQEALLMGYGVYGSDIDQRMVDYSIKNVQWLIAHHPQIETHVVIEQADATKDRLPRFSAVASEVYLGKPLKSLPPFGKLNPIIDEANGIVVSFLQNLLTVIPSDKFKKRRRIVLAVPAWRRPSGELIHLPVIAKLTDMGYNRVAFKHVRNDELIYFRENQVVARQLLVLERS